MRGVPVGLVLALVVSACGSGRAPGPVAGSTRPPGTPVGTSPSAAPHVVARPRAAVPVDPGRLPQTRQRPNAAGPAFQARVQALWSAILTGQPRQAMPFFFPRSAYLQVKAISDPATDWQQRLVADYQRDLLAAHRSLGPGQPRLVGLDVPAGAARWVLPGEEYNRLGYWRVYGSVLRYTVDGHPRSLPVYSLISWRGEWYVVHLGPP